MDNFFLRREKKSQWNASFGLSEQKKTEKKKRKIENKHKKMKISEKSHHKHRTQNFFYDILSTNMICEKKVQCKCCWSCFCSRWFFSCYYIEEYICDDVQVQKSGQQKFSRYHQPCGKREQKREKNILDLLFVQLTYLHLVPWEFPIQETKKNRKKTFSGRKL